MTMTEIEEKVYKNTSAPITPGWERVSIVDSEEEPDEISNGEG